MAILWEVQGFDFVYIQRHSPVNVKLFWGREGGGGEQGGGTGHRIGNFFSERKWYWLGFSVLIFLSMVWVLKQDWLK